MSASEAVSLAGAPRGGWLRWLRRTTVLRTSGLLVATVALLVVLELRDSRYLSVDNLQVLGIQMSQVGIAAVGMALLMISGNVDLSIGSMTGLVATASALLSRSTSVVVAILLGLAIGMGCGLFNGLLVWRIRISPIIITVGSLGLFHGIALLLNQGAAVPNVPAGFTDFGQATVLGFSLSFVVLVGLGLVSWFLLSTTVAGRHLYAIGGNREAAARVGIPLRRFVLVLFTFNGLLVGLAAVLLASRYGTASPEFGVGLEIQAITAVILGGVAFNGGEGSMAGVMLAVVFLVVLESAVIALGIDPYYADVIMGGALIVAVALDQLAGEQQERQRIALAQQDTAHGEPTEPTAPPPLEVTVPSRRSTH
jgi:ribose/xylose/arabinose/galactoside ABC-type transport system permease subunit